MSTQAYCRRKSTKPAEADEPRVEPAAGVWRIRSTEAVRQILREKDATRQAGFNSESIPGARKHQPILFMDGESHRQQRRMIARYFAPKTVSGRYRELMETRADALVAEMAATDSFALDDISLRYSTEVAAQVIGLTASRVPGLSRRLEKLLDQKPYDPVTDARHGRLRTALTTVRSSVPMAWFYVRDVRPAIRSRRRTPGEDVITHLLQEGYKDQEILIECVTYGAAGMATTREFISMATLHLLEDDALRARFLVAQEPERHAILHEILRLEPIVGHLYRRAASDITLTDAGQEYTIPAGDFLDLFVRQANADPTTVGDAPLDLYPARPLPRGIGPEVMSFGDGPHKCPGNSMAIQETDILLTRLLRHDLVMRRAPVLGWDEVIAGYSLRHFELSIPRPAAADAA